MDWGYLLQANDASSSDEKREIFVPHSGLSHIRFTMHLLGRHYPQAPLAVPDLLRNVIQVERDLPYNEVCTLEHYGGNLVAEAPSLAVLAKNS